jgi:hypothetical protein
LREKMPIGYFWYISASRNQTNSQLQKAQNSRNILDLIFCQSCSYFLHHIRLLHASSESESGRSNDNCLFMRLWQSTSCYIHAIISCLHGC